MRLRVRRRAAVLPGGCDEAVCATAAPAVPAKAAASECCLHFEQNQCARPFPGFDGKPQPAPARPAVTRAERGPGRADCCRAARCALLLHMLVRKNVPCCKAAASPSLAASRPTTPPQGGGRASGIGEIATECPPGMSGHLPRRAVPAMPYCSGRWAAGGGSSCGAGAERLERRVIAQLLDCSQPFCPSERLASSLNGYGFGTLTRPTTSRLGRGFIHIRSAILCL